MTTSAYRAGKGVDDGAPQFATALERDLHAALTEIMTAYRAYQSKPGPDGLRRIAAAETQADAVLAKTEPDGKED